MSGFEKPNPKTSTKTSQASKQATPEKKIRGGTKTSTLSVAPSTSNGRTTPTPKPTVVPPISTKSSNFKLPPSDRPRRGSNSSINSDVSTGSTRSTASKKKGPSHLGDEDGPPPLTPHTPRANDYKTPDKRAKKGAGATSPTLKEPTGPSHTRVPSGGGKDTKKQSGPESGPKGNSGPAPKKLTAATPGKRPSGSGGEKGKDGKEGDESSMTEFELQKAAETAQQTAELSAALMQYAQSGENFWGSSDTLNLKAPPSKGEADESIKVFVRWRPTGGDDQKEDQGTHEWAVDTRGKQIVLRAAPQHPYFFDGVFLPNSITTSVFQSVARPILDQVARGYNGTIFAYGQTGSGKTFTMMGDKDHIGVIPMSISYLFDIFRKNPDFVFLLRISYLELYNEEVNDLLDIDKRNLNLRETKEGGFSVVDITEKIVTGIEDVMAAIALGASNRSMGVSNLNEHSSRSHTIFRLMLQSGARLPDTGDGEVSFDGGKVKVSEFNLVDLAGSETLAQELGRGQQKETKFINLSLTNLKSVITKLSEKKGGKGDHIPYRSSKLTKILKMSLGGNSKTSLILTASSLKVHEKMSKSTLHFGSMAKKITNSASINEVEDDATVMLRQYESKIKMLEAKLADYGRIQEEKAKVEERYQEVIDALNSAKQRQQEMETKALADAQAAAEAHAQLLAENSAASVKAAEEAAAKRDAEIQAAVAAALAAAKEREDQLRENLQKEKLDLEQRLIDQQKERENRRIEEEKERAKQKELVEKDLENRRLLEEKEAENRKLIEDREREKDEEEQRRAAESPTKKKRKQPNTQSDDEGASDAEEPTGGDSEVWKDKYLKMLQEVEQMRAALGSGGLPTPTALTTPTILVTPNTPVAQKTPKSEQNSETTTPETKEGPTKEEVTAAIESRIQSKIEERRKNPARGVHQVIEEEEETQGDEWGAAKKYVNKMSDTATAPDTDRDTSELEQSEHPTDGGDADREDSQESLTESKNQQTPHSEPSTPLADQTPTSTTTTLAEQTLASSSSSQESSSSSTTTTGEEDSVPPDPPVDPMQGRPPPPSDPHPEESSASAGGLSPSDREKIMGIKKLANGEAFDFLRLSAQKLPPAPQKELLDVLDRAFKSNSEEDARNIIAQLPPGPALDLVVIALQTFDLLHNVGKDSQSSSSTTSTSTDIKASSPSAKSPTSTMSNPASEKESIASPATSPTGEPQRKSKPCQRCGRTTDLRCSGCKQAWYCSGKCQYDDWPTHKPACRKSPAATPVGTPGQATKRLVIPTRIAYTGYLFAQDIRVIAQENILGNTPKRERSESVDNLRSMSDLGSPKETTTSPTRPVERRGSSWGSRQSLIHPKDDSGALLTKYTSWKKYHCSLQVSPVIALQLRSTPEGDILKSLALAGSVVFTLPPTRYLKSNCFELAVIGNEFPIVFMAPNEQNMEDWLYVISRFGAEVRKVIKEGWLVKQEKTENEQENVLDEKSGSRLKTIQTSWKKYFCRLTTGEGLSCFRSQGDDDGQMKEPPIYLYTALGKIIQSADDKFNKPNCFEIELKGGVHDENKNLEEEKFLIDKITEKMYKKPISTPSSPQDIRRSISSPALSSSTSSSSSAGSSVSTPKSTVLSISTSDEKSAGVISFPSPEENFVTHAFMAFNGDERKEWITGVQRVIRETRGKDLTEGPDAKGIYKQGWLVRMETSSSTQTMSVEGGEQNLPIRSTNWKRYYCILKDKGLFYYKEPPASRELEDREILECLDGGLVAQGLIQAIPFTAHQKPNILAIEWTTKSNEPQTPTSQVTPPTPTSTTTPTPAPPVKRPSIFKQLTSRKLLTSSTEGVLPAPTPPTSKPPKEREPLIVMCENIDDYMNWIEALTKYKRRYHAMILLNNISLSLGETITNL